MPASSSPAMARVRYGAWSASVTRPLTATHPATRRARPATFSTMVGRASLRVMRSVLTDGDGSGPQRTGGVGLRGRLRLVADDRLRGVSRAQRVELFLEPIEFAPLVAQVGRVP